MTGNVSRDLETKSTAPFYCSDDAADMVFLVTIANVIKERKILEERSNRAIVLAAGEKSTGGPLIVVGGNDAVVQQVSKVVSQTLADDGVKGGGKGRWQGKTKSWHAIESLKEKLEFIEL